MLLDTDKDILERFDPNTILCDDTLIKLGWSQTINYSRVGNSVIPEQKYWTNKKFMKGILIELGEGHGYLYSYNTWGSHSDTVGDLMRIIKNNPKLLV